MKKTELRKEILKNSYYSFNEEILDVIMTNLMNYIGSLGKGFNECTFNVIDSYRDFICSDYGYVDKKDISEDFQINFGYREEELVDLKASLKANKANILLGSINNFKKPLVIAEEGEDQAIYVSVKLPINSIEDVRDINTKRLKYFFKQRDINMSLWASDSFRDVLIDTLKDTPPAKQIKFKIEEFEDFKIATTNYYEKDCQGEEENQVSVTSEGVVKTLIFKDLIISPFTRFNERAISIISEKEPCIAIIQHKRDYYSQCEMGWDSWLTVNIFNPDINIEKDLKEDEEVTLFNEEDGDFDFSGLI